MNIYMDESGPFVSPSTTHRVSAVGALVIPRHQHDELLQKFVETEQTWRMGSEAKGSQLSEAQVQNVIQITKDCDVIFDVSLIDMGLQTDNQTSEFKAAQADRFLNHIDSSCSSNVAEYMQKQHDSIEELSNQLFVQAFLTILLVERIVRTATLFYVQRDARELAEFCWIVDAKDIGGSLYERVWRSIALPLVQSQSAIEPFPTIPDQDYSHFERFFVSEAELPEHLRPFAVDDGGINFKLIMEEEFILGDSESWPGLRLVDVLIAAFTRALNGKLAEAGWKGLGSIMVARKPPTIQLEHLKVDAGGAKISVSVPYAGIVGQLESEAKSLWTVVRHQLGEKPWSSSES